MFPKTIVGASLVDRSPPRAGVAYDAVILRGESEAESSYVLRVGQEVVVSSDDPDEPFIARIGKLIFTPGDEPPWAFTCRWYYKIKEVADDNVRKNLAKHPKNVVFISRHVDTNPIDTILRPCEMFYFSGWQAQNKFPSTFQQRINEKLANKSSPRSVFVCCGSYDPTSKLIGPLQPTDMVGKQLLDTSSSAGSSEATPGIGSLDGQTAVVAASAPHPVAAPVAVLSRSAVPAPRISVPAPRIPVPSAPAKSSNPAMRYDFNSHGKRQQERDTLSLHFLNTRPHAEDGHVLTRVGSAYQADVPDFPSGNQTRPKAAATSADVPGRSWAPHWIRDAHIFNFKEIDSAPSYLPADNARRLADFVRRAESMSIDWRIGMHVGVPHSSRLESGVLLCWNDGEAPAGVVPFATQLRPPTGQSLLYMRPSPGIAYVAVPSRSAVLQLPLASVKVANDDLLVTQEHALYVLMRYNRNVSAALDEIDRYLKGIRRFSASSVSAAVRAPNMIILHALKMLAGSSELTVVPHTPQLAPIVSAVSAAKLFARHSSWNCSQQIAFAYSYNRFGKDFLLFRVPGKTSRECVAFFYQMKHYRMLISGMGFCSRNPTESRWRSATTSLSNEERQAIEGMGWSLVSDPEHGKHPGLITDEVDSRSAPAASEGVVPADATSGDSTIAASATPASGSSKETSGADSTQSQDRVELTTRSSRPVIHWRGSSAYSKSKPSERAAHIQLGTAVICCGGAHADVQKLLDGFVLFPFDPSYTSEHLQFDASDLDLRGAQKPRSTLDPFNSTRACSTCRKTSSLSMVCCNPQCAIVSCEVCFKLEAMRVESSIKLKPSWKLARNNPWWLCLGCCMVLPTKGEVQRRQRIDDTCTALHELLLKQFAEKPLPRIEEEARPVLKRRRETSAPTLPPPSSIAATALAHPAIAQSRPQTLVVSPMVATPLGAPRPPLLRVVGPRPPAQPQAAVSHPSVSLQPPVPLPLPSQLPSLPVPPQQLTVHPPSDVHPVSQASAAAPDASLGDIPASGAPERVPLLNMSNGYIKSLLRMLPLLADHIRLTHLMHALTACENARDSTRAVVAFLVSRGFPLDSLRRIESFLPVSQRRYLRAYIAEFVLLFCPLASSQWRALLSPVAQGTASGQQLAQFEEILMYNIDCLSATRTTIQATRKGSNA